MRDSGPQWPAATVLFWLQDESLTGQFRPSGTAKRPRCLPCMDTKALEEVIAAYRTGVSRDACPYPPWTMEYYDWLGGWDDAERIDWEKAEDLQRNGR